VAKRQNNDSTSQNVVRIDGEGKVHGNGGSITPLCKFRGHGDHTWVTTGEAVTCGRCVTLHNKREDARKRLEYAANVRDTQDDVYSQGDPNAYSEGALRDLDIMAKGEPVTVPMAEALKAVTPVVAENGETVTVPVDYDNPSAGRRELDASKGERVISEDTYRVRTRTPLESLREDAPLTAEAVQAMIRKLQSLPVMQDARESEGFSVEFHAPKNGECPDVEIPTKPEGVNANTWELAHTANTESARAYWTRKAEAERTAFLDAQEAMEKSRKAVKLETPPF